MIDLGIVFVLLFTHWLADFVLQTDQMAKGKSTSNKWLSIHILCYSLPFLTFMLTLGVVKGLIFVAVNAVAHFVTDYFTSRLSSKLWNEGQVHYFFVIIGFDQMIHMMTLIGTYYWISSL